MCVGCEMTGKRKKKENRARHFHNSVGDGNQYQGNSQFLIQKFYRTCFEQLYPMNLAGDHTDTGGSGPHSCAP